MRRMSEFLLLLIVWIVCSVAVEASLFAGPIFATDSDNALQMNEPHKDRILYYDSSSGIAISQKGTWFFIKTDPTGRIVQITDHYGRQHYPRNVLRYSGFAPPRRYQGSAYQPGIPY